MKIVLRTVLSACTLAPASERRETAGRRSITFSPSGGATVVLGDRVPRSAPAPVAVAT